MIENCAVRENDLGGIPEEVLALCAQVRSELSKLEAHGGKRSQLFRATKALAKSGAPRIFSHLKKNGDSINELAKRIGWSKERALLLVSGQQIPFFWEIPKIAAALEIEVPALLAAFGFPEQTFQSTEALSQAILMEAERKPNP